MPDKDVPAALVRAAIARAAGLLLACAGAPALAVSQAAGDVRWFTLSHDGERTGYVREERRDEPDAIVETQKVTIVVRQLGRQSRVERHIVYRHTAAGVPISYDYESVAGVEHKRWHGSFEGMTLVIRGDARPRTVALPDDTVFTPDPAARP